MIRVRDNVLNMAPYHPPLAGRAAMLRMDFNENLQGPSPSVLRAAATLGAADLSVYPDDRAAGEAAANFFKVPVESLLLTNGADEAIQCAVNLLVDKGDVIPLFEPTYAMYRIYLSVAGATVESLLYNDDLSFPRERLREAAAKKPKLMFLCAPNNPTGTAVDYAWLRGEVAAHPDVAFVVDEAYADFAGRSLLDGGMADWPQNLLVLRTFSKSCGLAGLRVGAILGAPEVVALLRKIRSPYSIAGLSLTLLMAALRDPGYIAEYIRTVVGNRETARAWLEQKGVRVYPSEANFLLLRVGPKVNEVCARLAEGGILVRSRDKDPLLAGCFRVTIGPDADMRRFYEAFEGAL